MKRVLQDADNTEQPPIKIRKIIQKGLYLLRFVLIIYYYCKIKKNDTN